MKSVLLQCFALLVSITVLAQDKYCVDEIRELKLQSLSGKITTYYAQGSGDRANELKQLLERASQFFEDSLRVKPAITMAVLSPKEWSVLMDRPYGLPTTRLGGCKRGTGNFAEARYAAIMPAGINGPLYNDWMKLEDSVSAATLEKLKDAGVTFEQGGKILIDFVGLHEVGHVYAHAIGINYYTNFFAELMADYLAYAFLRSTEERLDKKVLAILSAHIDGITPVHSSFTRYERFRSSEHPPTEAWYNSIITLKAAEIYEQRGVEFLFAVQKAFPEAEGKLNTETIIARLESIHPGIIKWSEGISANVRRNRSPMEK